MSTAARYNTMRIQPQGKPRCPRCAQRLSKYAFGSDSVTGRTTVTCPDCGTQPVVVRVPANFHRYDQRERLMKELLAKQERAEAPIQEVA